MSNDFLQSSPSRQTIDPLIYNSYPPDENKKEEKSKDVAPPSAQKTQLTGWTPLISKTYYSDQFISYNSTPSSKFLNGVLSNHPGLSSNNEIDYASGLNLTPFLTHNIGAANLSTSGSINGLNTGLNSTPFHDKTLHLTDFFMDSPIRQSPIKDLDTITPSKFKLGSGFLQGSAPNSEKKFLKHSIFLDLNKSALKRSITQLDTPPRQPHKLSITTKADLNQTDDEEDEEEDSPEKDSKKAQDSKYALDTPLKKPVLTDKSNFANTKTPIKSSKMPMSKREGKENSDFETPRKPIPVSSPSTVIMSSTAATPRSIGKDNLANSKKVNIPPSPTPKKELNIAHGQRFAKNKNGDLRPTMGVFQEKKTNSKTGNGPHERYGFNEQGTKKNNKAQMQAGMNKFQIVFTDVHTLMNNKNKNNKKFSHLNASRLKKSEKAKMENEPPAQPDFNSTMNTSKEYSIMSQGGGAANNTSINTSSSNLNMSSQEHSSFEMGVASTPNGRYFLDKMFDKPSPQTQTILAPHTFYTMPATHLQMTGQYNGMPPPQKAQSTQKNVPSQPPVMVMMSTPQHQNVLNYNLYGNSNEFSPSSDLNHVLHDNHLNSFSYHTMGYTKGSPDMHN